MSEPATGAATGRVVAALCFAEILNMAGTMTFPALIPTFVTAWSLSNSEAGWIAGIAFAGYVATAPFLTALTDRLDARRVVIAGTALAAASSFGFAFFAHGFWSAMLWRLLSGIALAAGYMPGLKALTDRVAGPRRSRYQAFYTASYSIGTALSLFQAGIVAGRFGWRAAFAVAGGVALLALPLLAWVPAKPPPVRSDSGVALFDPRPVLRHRAAMAYILAYAAHCFELFGFRTWLVAFLTFSATFGGDAVADDTITTVATIVLLLGLPASVLGNEVAIRIGRRRFLVCAMALSAALALVVAFSVRLPFAWMVALTLLYGFVLMADSASLTVGAVDAAPPERRGATIAVHTFMGSAASFVSPLVLGGVLDLAGGSKVALSWTVAFIVIAATVALGPLALLVLGHARTARPDAGSGDGTS